MGAHMQTIVSSAEGGTLQDMEAPRAGPGMVVVRVHAAALNRADLAMLTGASHGFAGGMGMPLGLEWAGEIAAVGDKVEGFLVGDRVMGAGPGAFADFVVANPKWIYRIPEGMPYTQAAALPVSLQTMHDALVSNGQFVEGQTVLVQGASSAMGLMALQMAKQLGAAVVIGTSTDAARRAQLAEFGADYAINTRDSDWVRQVHKATRMKGVDLCIDLLAGPLINDTVQATRIGGRIVNVGRMAGERVELDLDQHSQRRITHVGVTFRTRTPAEIADTIDRASQAWLAPLAAGCVRMPVDQVFAFADFRKAFERMAQNRHFGKIVLAMDAAVPAAA